MIRLRLLQGCNIFLLFLVLRTQEGKDTTLTLQRLKDLERELSEVKSRLNGLIFLVAGAVVVDVVLKLVRPG